MEKGAFKHESMLSPSPLPHSFVPNHRLESSSRGRGRRDAVEPSLDKKALSVNDGNERSSSYHSGSSARGPAILACLFPTSPWRGVDCFRALQHRPRHSPAPYSLDLKVQTG